MTKGSRFDQGVRDMERGNYADAITWFTQAFEANDNTAHALSKRGVCHIRLGERELASRDFHNALTIDAACISAIVNLGNMALEDGRVEEAQRRYQDALALDADYALAHHNLGVAYRRLGKMADSVRELRLAARLEGRAKNPLWRLGAKRKK